MLTVVLEVESPALPVKNLSALAELERGGYHLDDDGEIAADDTDPDPLHGGVVIDGEFIALPLH